MNANGVNSVSTRTFGFRPAASSDRALNILYWSLPLVLTGVQYWVTATSMHEIRNEELAESVRNVFWLSHRLVYDGASSNIGWHGMLLIVYELFGFSLHSAKFVRLGLYFIGLTCAADILRRFMGLQTAIVPLVAMGLSPILLYFTSLQTSNGIDLPYAAISLWLLLSVRPDSRTPLELAKIFLCGMVVMIAAMSYPTFLLYWPSFLLVAVWWTRGNKFAGPSLRWRTWQGLSATAGLAIPLLIAFTYVITPGLLFLDPATHSGLFRGGGVLGFDPVVFTRAVFTVLRDLMLHGQSYEFEVSRPDFFGPLAIVGLCSVAITTIYLWVKRQAERTILIAAVMLLAVNLVVPCLAIGAYPGIRRSTGILAAYFALFSISWYFYRTTDAPIMVWARRTGIFICLLVPLDNALKIPSLVRDLAQDSKFRNTDWFAIAATPTKSLELLLAQLDGGERLSCPVDDDQQITHCRYQEVYAAIAGYQLWNYGWTPDIWAIDWKTGREINLTPSLWTSYYFPH
jgi:hypothetical protein